ncbi:hypothetical protein NFI96_026178, partial [Prochilodus magdalenae]
SRSGNRDDVLSLVYLEQNHIIQKQLTQPTRTNQNLTICLVLSTGSSDVVRSVGDSVQLDTQRPVPEFDELIWEFNRNKSVVKYYNEFNKTKQFPGYEGRVEFSERTYTLTLKNLQKTDSGLYEARVAGDQVTVVAGYSLSVLDPVEAPVLTHQIIRHTCNITLTCRGHDLSISSSCYKETCEENNKTSPGGVTLSLSVRGSSIICNHSNLVSWKIKTLEMRELKRFCADRAGMVLVGLLDACKQAGTLKGRHCLLRDEGIVAAPWPPGHNVCGKTLVVTDYLEVQGLVSFWQRAASSSLMPLKTEIVLLEELFTALAVDSSGPMGRGSSDVVRSVGGSVQLDIRDTVPEFDDLSWLFNRANPVVKYYNETNKVKQFPAYKNRVEFNEGTYTLTLKNLRRTDSGLYEARASGDVDTVVAKYSLSVLDPVEAPVLTHQLIRDTCNITLTCRGHDLSISSSCYNETCEEKNQTSPGGVTLSLSVRGSFIICMQSNPVSLKEDVLEMGELKQPCTDGETWLLPEIPNEAIEPAGFSVHRADRTKDLSGQSKGGGVWFLINAWCDQRNVHFTESFCSPDIEYLTISCRPRWLPREVSGVIVTAVYIPPQADADLTLGKLYEAVNRQETACIVVGDFNKANFRKVAPKFVQHVLCSTRGSRMLDHCYTHFHDVYKPLPRPQFGKSDHSSILLLPTYRQKLKQAPPTIRDVHRWTDQSDSMLQDCFDHVDWEMFWEALTIRAALTAAFKSGHMEEYKKASYALRKTIRAAKREYRAKVESQFNTTNTRSLWQGLNTITDFRRETPSVDHISAALPDELNTFYARFEVNHTVHPERAPATADSAPHSVSVADVCKAFKRVNIRKSPGPDGIPGRILKGCVLSPLLYSLYTHDRIARHSSNVIIKSADDTTAVGLISNNNEEAYRKEVSFLTHWCRENNLSLNVNKTKKLIVDLRKQERVHTPITINGAAVERVSSFKLRQLRRFGMDPRILRTFYTCTVESILTGSITTWYGSCTAIERKALQRVVRTAQYITGVQLPNLLDLYTSRCRRKTRRVLKDSTHPSHCLFSQLPSGRRFRRQDGSGGHSILVGTVAIGRAGLGSNPKPSYSKASVKEKRNLVQEEVCAKVEEACFSRMVGMSKQGAWTKWEHTTGRKITWAELWKVEPHHFKFLVLSVYDVLPSPANLFTWGLVDSPACQLCQKRGTLEHILSCCSKALGEGRYCWRHNQVLRAVADSICTGINNSKRQHPSKCTIASPSPQARPGGVVLVELTVPWEDQMEEAKERRKAKYTDLVADCRRNGWKARCETTEVGCRGFAGQSLHRVLGLLGICGLHRRGAMKNITEAAEKTSRWLWLRRGDAWHSGLPGYKTGPDHPRLGLLGSSDVVRSVGGSVQLDIRDTVPEFDDLSWLFNRANPVVKYYNETNKVKQFPAYKNRVEFNEGTYTLTLKDLRRTDSGLYEARASGDVETVVAKYSLSVLDPVEAPVLTHQLIRDTCNITLTCRGHDLSISSSCYNETCEEKNETSPGGVTLSLSVRGSFIICMQSNPVSLKEDVLEVGELKRPCTDGGEGVSEEQLYSSVPGVSGNTQPEETVYTAVEDPHRTTTEQGPRQETVEMSTVYSVVQKVPQPTSTGDSGQTSPDPENEKQLISVETSGSNTYDTVPNQYELQRQLVTPEMTYKPTDPEAELRTALNWHRLLCDSASVAMWAVNMAGRLGDMRQSFKRSQTPVFSEPALAEVFTNTFNLFQSQTMGLHLPSGHPPLVLSQRSRGSPVSEMAMMKMVVLQSILVLSTLISSTGCSDVVRSVGDSVQLDVQHPVPKFDELSWMFNGTNNVLKFNNDTKKAKQYPGYEGRVKFNTQTYSLTLKNLQKADSGLYVARASGFDVREVAEYRLSVLVAVAKVGSLLALGVEERGESLVVGYKYESVALHKFSMAPCDLDPVEAPVMTHLLIRDTCNITLTCRGHDLSISSSCYNETCEEKEVTSPGGVNLSLSVRGSSIICNHRNPVSRKEAVLEMGELKRLCADGGAIDLFRPAGSSVQLHIQHSVPNFDDLSWMFNETDNVLKYYNESKEPRQYPGYKHRVEFNERNYSLTLKDLQKTDSGLYQARASGREVKFVAEYRLSVLETRHYGYEDRVEFNERTYSLTLKNLQKTDSGLYEARASNHEATVVAEYRLSVLDPVEAPVLTHQVNSDTCNITLTCRGHDLSINSSCYKETCEEKNETSPGGVTLSLSVRDSSIICNHSNPVSWKEAVLEMGELEQLCADGGEHGAQGDDSKSTGVVVSVVVTVVAVIIISISISVYVYRRRSPGPETVEMSTVSRESRQTRPDPENERGASSQLNLKLDP